MQAVVAAVLAAVLVDRGVPLSVRLARHTDFLDRPTGYKAHLSSTPYLGGAAVLTAILLTASLFGSALVSMPVILICAAMLASIGTLDDRLPVSPKWRLLAELAAAVAVWSVHRGFTVFASEDLNLGVTIVWVVGIVNAFNLIDNIDGACATLAAVSAVGIGVIGLIHGQWDLAVTSMAAAGACAGFLRHNLARPARIFLGDGGSMPLGFLIACLAMAVVRGRSLGASELFACGLLAGVPVLDTTLVMLSRRRRGLSVLTAGCDHLTHRLLARLRTPRRVALLLAALQAMAAASAVLGDRDGGAVFTALGIGWLALGAVALAVLESPAWSPAAVVPVASGAPHSIDGSSAPLPALSLASAFDDAHGE
jgi:UDP-GlcNAc:undecaprenyl-phosphate GlcNAc-1-phosphate transferase